MSKKRKAEASADVIRIGNKTISLEGYLTKRPKNTSTTPTTTPPNSDLKSSNNQPSPSLDQQVLDQQSKSVSKFVPSRKPSGAPEYLKTRQALPLWSHQDEIRRRLHENDVLVLVGETGSGKSTQVPQFLYQEKWCQRQMVKVEAKGRTEEVAVGGMIAITQPRRVAATTLAHRVSCEAGTPLKADKGGKAGGGSDQNPHSKGLVGYSVRFDHRVPKGTKIKYVTEGMLLQELLRDPHLRQYSAVIVDEIHERSVDVDLLSGFLKQIVTGNKAGRGGVPLKVIIMSATANVGSIKRFFSDESPGDSEPVLADEVDSSSPVQFLQIEGRQFPVEITHTPKPVPDIQDSLLKTIFKIHTEEPLQDKYGRSDILAFLTGQEEIESAQRLIEEYAATLPANVPTIRVFPLFGQMSMEGQHEAFQPVKGGFTRKVVLATNIAESQSLPFSISTKQKY